jgi:hypothetical protein
MAMDGFINVTAFTILAALWLAFATALVASRSSLDATWRGVGALPLPVKGLVWLLTLPLVVALAVWEGAWRTRSWPVIVRLLVVAGLAVATLNAFFPRGI